MPPEDSTSDGADTSWADSADRKVAIRALAEHRAEDRLTGAEHDRRRGAAEQARTVGELRALFADLPAPHPLLGEGTAGGAAWVARLARAGGGAGLLLGTGGVIVLAALLAGWWVPALLFTCLIVVAAVLVAAGRR